MKLYISGAYALLLASCASVHPGNLGVPVSNEGGPKFKVSALQVGDLSDAHYGFVSVTLENTTPEIQRVLEGTVMLDSQGKMIPNILVGGDLVAWIDSARAREKVDRQNASAWAQVLAVGGLMTSVAGTAGRSNALSGIGGVATTVGVGKMVADKTRQGLQDAETAERFPESHLSGRYSVPAGMFARKWIVFEKKNGLTPKGLFVKLTLQDQSEEVYATALQ